MTLESARWSATNGEGGRRAMPEIRQRQEWYGQMQPPSFRDERVAMGRNIIQAHADNVWMISRCVSSS